jgi:type IV secretory pathway VirB2 component (pilin)
MIKKIFKKNQLNNILRITALVEAVIVIILIAIAFSTKNAFLFKVLLYIGGITAFFAMSMLFLELTGIIDTKIK